MFRSFSRRPWLCSMACGCCWGVVQRLAVCGAFSWPAGSAEFSVFSRFSTSFVAVPEATSWRNTYPPLVMSGQYAAAAGLLFGLMWPEWWWRWGLILSWGFVVASFAAEGLLSRAMPLLLVTIPCFAAALSGTGASQRMVSRDIHEASATPARCSLDELPQFSPQVLDTLREPMQEGRITIARGGASPTYPARFTLIARDESLREPPNRTGIRCAHPVRLRSARAWTYARPPHRTRSSQWLAALSSRGRMASRDAPSGHRDATRR